MNKKIKNMNKKIKIDSDIYSEKLLIEAIGDFEEIASIKYENNILIIDGNSIDEIDEVFNELMNYVITLDN